MADIALGSVGKIVEVALKIKEAVETVKQNEKECRDIQRCVARVTALLKKLDETTETMKDEAMRDALEDLAESLERALELVTKCQRRHFVSHLWKAGEMAKELGRVQDDIVRKLQLGNFATNVQTTIMVTNIQSSAGAPPPPPPPPPPEREVVDGFIQFSFSELKAATEDFSAKNIIGSGGYGVVYKGILHDGELVAIKKMVMVDDHRQDGLYDEINICIELKHKNVATPLGYSHEIIMVLTRYKDKYVGAEHRRFCFVQEYMPNGSMDHAIKNGSVDWSSCFKMIQGIAQGLYYLHEQRVVHLDFKLANILLDSNMNPQINDFGLAKKLDHGDDEMIMDSILGTLAYMAPEHLERGIVSTKCDVFAFGCCLIETISCMRLNGHERSPGWAWKAVVDSEGMEELFDLSLYDKSQLVQIKRCMWIGLLCIEYDRKDRPTMADALAMLNGEKELPALKKPYAAD